MGFWLKTGVYLSETARMFEAKSYVFWLGGLGFQRTTKDTSSRVSILQCSGADGNLKAQSTQPEPYFVRFNPTYKKIIKKAAIKATSIARV